ncbi:MAG: DNA-directed RNA polymerase subunit D [Euryarchaeota archaeon]|nr:DNA-directed RNA polymerase subunit D [Euryarchaeota archaeon]
MKVTRLSTSNSATKLLIDDVDVGFINTLRRVLVSEIPIYAVDHIVIHTNTSVLFDEVLAHRIGLIPLSTPLNVKKEVTLGIEKEGPCTVYAKDMVSDDELITPSIPDIPILKLGDNQTLKVTCIATIGTAKEHAKYQSSLAFYKNFPIITVDDTCDLCGLCVEACPKGILEVKDDSVEVTDIKECTLCRSCEEQCDLEAITISHEPRKFIFTIEPYGNMDTENLIKTATEIIETKCDEFIDALAGVAEHGQRR